MILYRSGLTVLCTCVLSSWVTAKVPEMASAPDFPTAPDVVVWTSTPTNRLVERLPTTSKEFEAAFVRLLKQSPDVLGLPAGATFHVDAVQLSPAADGIPAMAFVRLTQTVEETPVAGTQTAFVVQWSSSGSPLRISQGRLYPDLKKLPEKPLAKDEAEHKIWEKLSTEVTRFETVYGGTWVRWLDGKWRTIQLYGVTPQGVLAAVDGAGTVFTWPGHVAPVPENAKTPKS